MNDEIFEETISESELMEDPRLRDTWSEDVMALFTEKEINKIDGKDYPNVNGLRRVARIILGKVVVSQPVQVWPYSDGRATVLYQLVFENGEVFGDVADVSGDNTDQTFLAFAVASASTRAESRCLRKALMIHSPSAEEMDRSPDRNEKADVKPETESRKFITESQLDLIDLRCKGLDINTKKFILGTKYERVADVEFEDGKKRIIKVAEFVNGTKEVPKSLLGYKPNWRD